MEGTGDLFGRPGEGTRKDATKSDPNVPLADRMRPKNIQDFVGHRELLGQGRLLQGILAGADMPSLIFWGPPGVGKTTLARLIADASGSRFVEMSATRAGVREVREIADIATRLRSGGVSCLLFLDEIHRFNKGQQDTLLPFVEGGDLVLVGATTENPSFQIITPLLSRCRIVRLEPLSDEEVVTILERALQAGDPIGLGDLNLRIDRKLLETIARIADGDARVALGTLDLAACLALQSEGDERGWITEAIVREALQSSTLRYDKDGDEHFNQISAFHKSVRNSDADASIYWLARMLEAGEDPVYVARRLLRVASEDIGLADPRALGQAVGAFQAVQCIGMPEAALSLAQAAVYLALAPKSNAVYRGYGEAVEEVNRTRNLPVPLHLRNAPTSMMRQMGYGQDYRYAHEEAMGVAAMECLPDGIGKNEFYKPTERGYEAELRLRLEQARHLKKGE